jgi:hypothetical protein
MVDLLWKKTGPLYAALNRNCHEAGFVIDDKDSDHMLGLRVCYLVLRSMLHIIRWMCDQAFWTCVFNQDHLANRCTANVRKKEAWMDFQQHSRLLG